MKNASMGDGATIYHAFYQVYGLLRTVTDTSHFLKKKVSESEN